MTSIIGFLFPAFGVNGGSTGGNLAPGGNPEKVNTQWETEVLKTYSVIPKQVKREDLLKLNKRAAALSGQTYLAQKYSNLAQQAAQSANQLEEIKAEHSAKMMEAHRKSASTKSKHGRAVQRHQLSSQITNEYYNEYSNQLQKSSNLIDGAFR